MSDSNYIPETIEYPVEINGVSIPVAIFRDIFAGYASGVAYALLNGLLALFYITPLSLEVGLIVLTITLSLLGLSIGVKRRSRVSSVLLFFIPVISIIYSAWQPGPVTGYRAGVSSGWVVPAIFLYFLGKGIRGTFTFHRLTKNEA